MLRSQNKYLLRLLVKVYNRAITDYFYFPQVVFAGDQRIEREDFEALLSEQLIAASRYDSFGRYYTLSKKGQSLLQKQLSEKQHRKKPAPVPLIQGCLYFSRFRKPHANTGSCLLFF